MVFFLFSFFIFIIFFLLLLFFGLSYFPRWHFLLFFQTFILFLCFPNSDQPRAHVQVEPVHCAHLRRVDWHAAGGEDLCERGLYFSFYRWIFNVLILCVCLYMYFIIFLYFFCLLYFLRLLFLTVFVSTFRQLFSSQALWPSLALVRRSILCIL